MSLRLFSSTDTRLCTSRNTNSAHSLRHVLCYYSLSVGTLRDLFALLSPGIDSRTIHIPRPRKGGSHRCLTSLTPPLSTPGNQSFYGTGRSVVAKLLNQAIETRFVNHVVKYHGFGQKFFAPLPKQFSFAVNRAIRNLRTKDQHADQIRFVFQLFSRKTLIHKIIVTSI